MKVTYEIEHDAGFGTATKTFHTLAGAVEWGDKQGPGFLYTFGIKRVVEVTQDEISVARSNLRHRVA